MKLLELKSALSGPCTVYACVRESMQTVLCDKAWIQGHLNELIGRRTLVMIERRVDGISIFLGFMEGETVSP